MFSKKQPCPQCNNRIKKDFDFCPHCGLDMRNPQKEMEDYGLLGKTENAGMPMIGGGGMGISEKLIQSIFNSLMKNLEKNMRNANHGNEIMDSHVQNLPNGVKIQIGIPVEQQRKPRRNSHNFRSVSKEQLKKMEGLPRVEAKTNVRRVGDKVLYELKTGDIESIDDVFVSRVESGYEIKAIGKKKVYINTLPVDLPLRSYSIDGDGLIVEFSS